MWLAAVCLLVLEKYGFFFYPALWMGIVFLGLFYLVLSLLAIPLAATMVRRLHDVGRSGIWLVCLGLPALGWLLLWYLSYGESQLGENRYGDPPWN